MSDTDGAGIARYSTDEDCRWYIECPTGVVSISVTVQTYDRDFLRVYPGRSTSTSSADALFAHSGPMQTFTNHTNYPGVTVYFQSVDYFSYPRGEGFTLSYVCISPPVENTPESAEIIVTLLLVAIGIPTICYFLCYRRARQRQDAGSTQTNSPIEMQQVTSVQDTPPDEDYGPPPAYTEREPQENSTLDSRDIAEAKSDVIVDDSSRLNPETGEDRSLNAALEI